MPNFTVSEDIDTFMQSANLAAMKTFLGITGSSASFVFASSAAVLDSNVFTGGGTDDTAAIQGILDLAQTLDYLCLVMDGAALVSGLNIYGNTMILCLEGAGFFLKDASNRSVLRNVNRTPDTGARVDKQIKLIGGIYNGNNPGQTLTVREPDDTVFSILQFAGVEDVTVDGVTLLDSRAYASQFGNCENVHFNNIKIINDDGVNGTNHDGLHFLGNSSDIWINGCNLRCWDDSIAFNANDVNHGPYYTDGPIENVFVDDIYLDGSITGIRLLSSTERIDRVHISNVSGSCHSYVVVINHFTFPGLGDIGRVEIQGLNVEVLPIINNTAGWTDPGCININVAAEQIVIEGLRFGSLIDDRHIIYVQADSDIEILRISNFSGSNDDDTLDDIRPVSVEGTVGLLCVEGFHWTDTTATGMQSMMETQTGAVVGVLQMNRWSVTDSGAIAMFVQEAGTVGRIVACNLYHLPNAASLSTFIFTGTIAKLTVSNWDGPADVYSLSGAGAVTAEAGDAFLP